MKDHKNEASEDIKGKGYSIKENDIFRRLTWTVYTKNYKSQTKQLKRQ